MLDNEFQRALTGACNASFPEVYEYGFQWLIHNISQEERERLIEKLDEQKEEMRLAGDESCPLSQYYGC